jgi:hypothetical protein
VVEPCVAIDFPYNFLGIPITTMRRTYYKQMVLTKKCSGARSVPANMSKIKRG